MSEKFPLDILAELAEKARTAPRPDGRRYIDDWYANTRTYAHEHTFEILVAIKTIRASLQNAAHALEVGADWLKEVSPDGLDCLAEPRIHALREAARVAREERT